MDKAAKPLYFFFYYNQIYVFLQHILLYVCIGGILNEKIALHSKAYFFSHIRTFQIYYNTNALDLLSGEYGQFMENLDMARV